MTPQVVGSGCCFCLRTQQLDSTGLAGPRMGRHMMIRTTNLYTAAPALWDEVLRTEPKKHRIVPEGVSAVVLFARRGQACSRKL